MPRLHMHIWYVCASKTSLLPRFPPPPRGPRHPFAWQVISYAPPGGGLLVQLIGPNGYVKPKPTSTHTADEVERRLGYTRQVERLRSEISAIKGEIEVERQRCACTCVRAHVGDCRVSMPVGALHAPCKHGPSCACVPWRRQVGADMEIWRQARFLLRRSTPPSEWPPSACPPLQPAILLNLRLRMRSPRAPSPPPPRFMLKGGDTAMLAMSAPFTIQVSRLRGAGWPAR